MSWTDLPDLTELLLRLGCAREQSRDARHKPEKIDGFIPTAPGKILHQLQLVHPEGLGSGRVALARGCIANRSDIGRRRPDRPVNRTQRPPRRRDSAHR